MNESQFLWIIIFNPYLIGLRYFQQVLIYKHKFTLIYIYAFRQWLMFNNKSDWMTKKTGAFVVWRIETWYIELASRFQFLAIDCVHIRNNAIGEDAVSSFHRYGLDTRVDWTL